MIINIINITMMMMILMNNFQYPVTLTLPKIKSFKKKISGRFTLADKYFFYSETLSRILITSFSLLGV